MTAPRADSTRCPCSTASLYWGARAKVNQFTDGKPRSYAKYTTDTLTWQMLTCGKSIGHQGHELHVQNALAAVLAARAIGFGDGFGRALRLVRLAAAKSAR